jgi:hypothetical protein
METTFKERLENERIELNERINKLGDFIVSDKFQSVQEVQQSLLNIQFAAMNAYSQCLLERLKWLEK